MRCLFCGKGMADGVALYRLNAKGEVGKWACGKHIKNTDATVDPQVQEIMDALQGRPSTSGGK